MSLVSCGRGIHSAVGPNESPRGFEVLSGRTGLQVLGVVMSAVSGGVRFEAPDFLPLISSQRGRIVLRPHDLEMSLAYTASLVYHNERTFRFATYVRRVSIMLPLDIRRPDIIARFERILQTANNAQNAIKFVLNDYSADILVNVRFNPSDPAFSEGSLVVAFTRVRFSSEGIIQEAEIILPTPKYVEFAGWFEVVMLHEIGHVLGLGHTPRGTPGLMSATLTGANFDFTSQEKITLFVNYSRIAGAKLKDGVEYEDANVTSHAATSTEVRVVCLR